MPSHPSLLQHGWFNPPQGAGVGVTVVTVVLMVGVAVVVVILLSPIHHLVFDRFRHLYITLNSVHWNGILAQGSNLHSNIGSQPSLLQHG